MASPPGDSATSYNLYSPNTKYIFAAIYARWCHEQPENRLSMLRCENMEVEKDTNNTEKLENDALCTVTNTCELDEQMTCCDVDEKLSESHQNLSKRQLKKVRKREKWLERKDEIRLREREKARKKRAHARTNNIDVGPSRKALKRCTMAGSSCKIGITIDLSFGHLMIDKDIAKLTKQILRCYTLNRRVDAPMQFSLTSFGGKAKADMEKHKGYEHWDVKFHEESYLNIYPKEKIIYLTSESENVITHLEHDHVYVIGGLVDHNSHKGLCHRLAAQCNVRHGRLPLDKFLRMKARKVLTVDHVFEILLRVSEGKTWQQAFLQVLPKRNDLQLILPPSGENNDESDPSNRETMDSSLVRANTGITSEVQIGEPEICT
ncbi:tRNA methyltransferase 10 homolog A isoform X2 [Ceratina calcarata]|uniref:tRNA (guanine(9)-N(1))-methyltransferase n=1 Tax=Ceratina calcarata TaxID=156304 RepID=A0AAJ7SA86_9HYME|nr:tRNA methyltransferase 10 homolog A isoform X2 [Ceratina calcarata]